MFKNLYNKIFASFLFIFVYSSGNNLTLSEILYEVSASKFYNQVIEIYNNSTTPIKITDYLLVSETRTNKIKLLTSSQQSEFSFLNGVFTNEYVEPNKVAVVIDSGYRGQVPYDFKGSLIYTIDTTSFSKGRFLKPADRISLLDKQKKVVDSWSLREVSDDSSLIKIDLAQTGYSDNLISIEPSLGEIAPLEVTLEPFDRINLEAVNPQPRTIGIPQSYLFTCRKGSLLSICNESFTLDEYEDRIFKLYYYPKGSRNLIDTSDAIHLTGGTSLPITLWPINLGRVDLSFNLTSAKVVADHSFLVHNYPSKEQGKLYLNEIFYNTNKNLVWLEVAVKDTVTIPLEVYLWNSDFNFKRKISFPEQTYLEDSYRLLYFHNADFTNTFAWYEKSIAGGEVLDLTAAGVIALSDGANFIDSVYYDKNWYDEILPLNSLQRKTLLGYAFTKDNFDISTIKKFTPGESNNFSKEIQFTVNIAKPFIDSGDSHLELKLSYSVGGELSVFIYDTNDELMGRIKSDSLKNTGNNLQVDSNIVNQSMSICLKKANLVISGRYRLLFDYQTNFGDIQSDQYFYFEL